MNYLNLLILIILSIHGYPTNAQTTGQVKHHMGIEYPGLLPHDLFIWLPPSYDSLQEKHYPVLYMHDGQNLFDPASSYSGVDWQLDETMDQLIRDKRVKEAIIVGIGNNADRNDEYIPGVKGKLYMKFIVHVIKPMVDSLYRTLTSPEFNFTGGSSAGGLIAFMLVWEYSDTFSGALCMSPAFKVVDEGHSIDYVKEVNNYKKDKKPIRVYIDNGGLDIENILQPGVDAMLIALKDKGYIDSELLYVKDPQSKHHESAWAKRAPKALMYLLGQ